MRDWGEGGSVLAERALERGAEWKIQPREWVAIQRECMICGYKERERGRSNRGRLEGEGGQRLLGCEQSTPGWGEQIIGSPIILIPRHTHLYLREAPGEKNAHSSKIGSHTKSTTMK